MESLVASILKIAAAVAVGLPLVVYLAQDSLIFYRQPLPEARRGAGGVCGGAERAGERFTAATISMSTSW